MNKSETASSELEIQVLGAQGSTVQTVSGAMINMSSNNYLGLANNAEIKAASMSALEEYGFGMASVRFLSGTHELHRKLEAEMSDFLQTDDCILFGSCYDANSGAFEALLDDKGAIFSDELNHASIIDGVRLSKAARYRFRHRDLGELRRLLRETKREGKALIVTDGVFSMDGTIAPLDGLVEIAREFNAFLFVDDSHGIGVVGETGRGTSEMHRLLGEIDLITGTFGKALGGAIGGFAAGRGDAIKRLRKSARPYIFSNPIPPHVAAGALTAIRILRREPHLIDSLRTRANFLRSRLQMAGIEIIPGEHAIVPVMLRSSQAVDELVSFARQNGVLVSGISFPVVPEGLERIRLQASAAHSVEELQRVCDLFSAWMRKFTGVREARSISAVEHRPSMLSQ